MLPCMQCNSLRNALQFDDVQSMRLLLVEALSSSTCNVCSLLPALTSDGVIIPIGRLAGWSKRN